MTEDLGPDARSLLSAAREGLSPGDAIAARVRAKVASTVAGAGAGAAATISTPTTAVTGASVLAKLAVVVVLAGVMIGGVALIATRGNGPGAASESRSGTAATGRAAVSPRTADSKAIAEITGSPIVVKSTGERHVDEASTKASAREMMTPTQAGQMTPPTNAGQTTAANAHGMPAGPTKAMPIGGGDPNRAGASSSPTNPSQIPAGQTPAGPTNTGHAKPVAGLAREVELIDLATRSLRDHKPQIALGAVHAFERETSGRGQLAEEAAAIEIEALCALHDTAAASKLDAFDLKWPSSAQRSRLTTSCQTP